MYVMHVFLNATMFYFFAYCFTSLLSLSLTSPPLSKLLTENFHSLIQAKRKEKNTKKLPMMPTDSLFSSLLFFLWRKAYKL